MSVLDRVLQGAVAILALIAIAAPLGTIWGLALLWPLLALRLGAASLAWRSPVFWSAVALAGWGAVTALWTPAPDTATAKLMQWALVLLPALLMTASLHRMAVPLKQKLSAAAVYGLIAGLVIIGVEILFGDPLYTLINQEPPPHPDGSSQRNRSLVLLAILIWPAALWLWRQHGWLAAAGVMLAALVAILSGESHSAILAWGLAGLILSLALWRQKIALWCVRVCLVLTVLSALPLAQIMFDAGLSENSTLNRNWRHRVDIWAAAVEHWQQKPMLGWGLSASRALPPAKTETFYSRFSESRIMLHPHNLPVQTALELGLIGMLPLTALLLTLSRLRPGTARADAAIRLATLTAGFAAAQAAFGAWQGWWLAGLILAAIMSILVDDAPSDVAPIEKGPLSPNTS